MKKGFSDEQWKQIVELAYASLELPNADRPYFVQSRSKDPAIAHEALVLAEELEVPEEEPPGLVGTPIGRFLIEGYLGAGGAGEVYSARDPELDRTVAIKLLRPEWTGKRDAEERFIREARAASHLNHPNIVTVHEVIRTDSTLAIVMELVDGVSLRQLCGKALALRKLLNIGLQMAQALAVAHQAGVVHRDIKPENVTILPDGRLKVLDFGLARSAPPGSGKSMATLNVGLPAGTLRYMSPEHYAGERLRAPSDIFAFGLMLYELGTGQHPFGTKAPLEILHAIATEEAVPPASLNPELPARLSATILAMMAKDPIARPTAEALVAIFEEIASPATAETMAPTRGRMVIPMRMVTAIAVLLIGALVVWRFYSGGPPPLKRIEQLTTLVPENRATAAAVSGDGKFLAYANVDGVFLRVIQSGETNALNGPHGLVVDQLMWEPDGTNLIVSGFSEQTNRPAIWSISITASTPRQLREDARLGVPSPDGSRIAFLSGDYSSIWTMDSGGQEPRLLLSAPPQDTFTLVHWSSNGRYLQFQRRHYSGQQDLGFVMFDRFYERSYESVDANTGAIVGRIDNLWIRSAATLPAGRAAFLRITLSGANFANELWETRIDLSNGKFSGALQKVATPLESSDHAFSLSATADGQKLIVLRESAQNAVFVADFEPAAFRFANARRLTLDDRANYPHAWTADSSTVIFESDRNGSYDLFRQHLDQRVPETIIATPKVWEVLPQLSPDGRFVLYASGPASGQPKPYTLMRVPVAGGTLQQIATNGPLDEFRCSTQPKGRCVVRVTHGRTQFVYSHLDPDRGIGRELARTSWAPSSVADWDVSPDGSQVAVPNHDSRSARIRVIDFEPRANQPQERELSLPGLINVSGLTWAADGSGWFVSVETSVGRRLFYCDIHGRVHPLGDIYGWAVPAPDGKKVAYLHRITESNAWVMSRE